MDKDTPPTRLVLSRVIKKLNNISSKLNKVEREIGYIKKDINNKNNNLFMP